MTDTIALPRKARDRMALPPIEALPAVLAADAWLYLEGPAHAPPPAGEAWAPHRAGSTRDAHYALYRFRGRPAGGAATLPGVSGTGGATPR